MIHLLIRLFPLFYYGRAQQTLYPAAIPLAVRSPYLSSWMFTINGTNLGALWPTTSAHQPSDQDPNLNSLNLPVLVRVDNITYSLLGYPYPINVTSNLTNTLISPTKTKLISQAGPMQFNLTFLNPIEPGDWVKQSIPFSYMSLTAKITGWRSTCCAGVFGYQWRMDVSGSKPEWGTLHYAMKSGGNITYKTARDLVPMNYSILMGCWTTKRTRIFVPSLPTTQFLPYQAISAPSKATQDPVVWAVGYIVDPAINYIDPYGVTHQRSLFYKTRYLDDTSLIVDFLNDFANASSRAQELDSKILEEAAPISGLLGDLVSLATAQNVGGLKTKPLFQLQAVPIYTNMYAAPDLGTNYPNVTIYNYPHSQGVEHSGNMLIMTYAHARASGDGIFISRYYDLLTSWAEYLCNSTLLIRNQSSADGLSTNNQTNLAIKGIVAIRAMSEMSSIVKHAADADRYSGAAASIYAQWKSLALGSDNRLLAVYRLTSSWSLGYNMFADVWLNTSVVESSVGHDGQGSFINNLTLTSTFSNFGVPVDNLGSDTGTADLRTNLISRVHNRAYNKSAGVFPIEYDSTIGITILEEPANLTTATGTSSKSHSGAIAGGTIGGLTVMLAIAFNDISWVFTQLHTPRFYRRGHVVTVMSYADSSTESALIAAVPVDVGPQADWEQQLAHGPFFWECTPHPLPPVVSTPIGLSGKELARLRSNGLRSQPTDRQPPDLS
ncbi:hypothetical protein H4582DRAFT_2133831 [Lactarius indigo]|nr:hypothetical protein H4582DRAFT_2133831 [Lactarius indigo]